jgi:hypothetical protein
MAEWRWSEAELAAELDAAFVAGAVAAREEPRAVAARYDEPTARLVVELASGACFMVPVRLLQGLAAASVEAVQNVTVVPGGEGLRWPALDVDLAVPALLMGSFGTRGWMRALGRLGGHRSSPDKAAAARRNGRLGGRPPRSKKGSGG